MRTTRNYAFLLSLLLAVLCAALFLRGRQRATGGVELVLHCAAGLRTPVSEIADAYKSETGVRVRIQFGGSGELASQLAVAGGDLYLPADASYIAVARAEGLVREAIPLASLTAGLAVPRGNPKQLGQLADLARTDLRVSLADPSAAVGRFTRRVLSQAGLWDRVAANAVVFKPTVNNVAEDVALGTVDAGVVWDAVAAQFPQLEFVGVPEFAARPQRATVGVLESSSHPTEALRFARYLAAADRGLPVFRSHRFAVQKGDPWASRPEITLFCGSMLRPAIREQLAAFERREGVQLNIVYEGCGTLVAQMRAGARPDAYFSCDVKFLDMVSDRFEPGEVVTRNSIVLLVPRGNPLALHSLAGLTRPGLKVGLAHPEKSALGDLSAALLRERGLETALRDSGNVAVLASKGDELVNQMQAGALHAALVYRSNALASPEIRETCETISLDDPGATASQPFAVSRDTPYRQLLARLQQTLTGAEGRAAFERFGFQWNLPADPAAAAADSPR